MKKRSPDWKSWGRTISFCLRISFKSSRKYFLISNFISILTIFVPFINIYLFSQLIQLLSGAASTENSANINDLLLLVGLVFATSLFSRVLENSKAYVNGMHREVMQNYASVTIMEKCAGLDVAFFDSSTFYNEMNDATRNGAYIVNTSFSIIDLLRGAAQLLVAVIALASFSWIFSLLLAFSVIPNIIYQRKQLLELYNIQRDNMELSRRIMYNSSIMQTRQNVSEVKLYNLFPFILEKYSQLWQTLFRKKQKTSFKYTGIILATSVLPEIANSTIIYTLGVGLFRGGYTLGQFSYYNGIAGQVLASMFSIINAYGQISDQKNRIHNFIKFLDCPNRMGYDGVRKVDKSRFELEFRKVSFRYEEQLPQVLKNVSFVIRDMEKTALVGVNGSGKSTVIKLILRFYDPTEGEILLNGVNIKEYDINDYRSSFSAMFQDYSKYAFKVGESVALSDCQFIDDDERIMSAIDKSGARGFVDNLKDGLDTHLTRLFSQDGAELSGGEWQKIALARTFFHEPQIFILDEPSASLDAESEDELFRKFEELYQNKGAILVSHRLSNVTTADSILVLDNGELIEEGSPDELLKGNGKFAHMFGLQADKYTVRTTVANN